MYSSAFPSGGINQSRSINRLLLGLLEFPKCGNKLQQDNKATTNNGTSDGRFLITTKGSVVFIEGSVSGHLIAMLDCSEYKAGEGMPHYS